MKFITHAQRDGVIQIKKLRGHITSGERAADRITNGRWGVTLKLRPYHLLKTTETQK